MSEVVKKFYEGCVETPDERGDEVKVGGTPVAEDLEKSDLNYEEILVMVNKKRGGEGSKALKGSLRAEGGYFYSEYTWGGGSIYIRGDSEEFRLHQFLQKFEGEEVELEIQGEEEPEDSFMKKWLIHFA